jgi:hypothetical protein
MTKLSKDLLPIYTLELDRGNEVARVDEPAGTNCPYAIIFKKPLHKNEIESELELPPSVQYWESRDAHYGKEAGYYSKETRHIVAGPLTK